MPYMIALVRERLESLNLQQVVHIQILNQTGHPLINRSRHREYPTTYSAFHSGVVVAHKTTNWVILLFCPFWNTSDSNKYKDSYR